MKHPGLSVLLCACLVISLFGCVSAGGPAGSGQTSQAAAELENRPLQPAEPETNPPVQNASLEQRLQEAVRYLEGRSEGRTNPLRVLGIGAFHFENKRIGSQFSLYLQEKLAAAVQGSRFELFEKDKLEQMMDAMRLSLTGLTDPETAVDPGKLKGLQGLVSGRFLVDGQNIIVFMELTDLETGTQVAKYEFTVDREGIPASVSVMPANYNDAVAVLEELKEVFNAGNEGFAVKMWNPRGDGAIFRNGEEYVINLFANRDCFIKVYHVGADNVATLVFPNQYYRNNSIKANQLYQIPDEKYPFRFKLKEPFGTEIVKCIASTVQFDDIEQSFTPLNTEPGGFRVRGWATVPVDEQITESIMTYTIIP